MKSPALRGRREGGRLSILTGIAVVTALAGVMVLFIALRGQESAPQPPSSASGRIDAPTSTPPSSTDGGKGSSTATSEPPQVGGAKQHPLPVSTPQHIDIPSIGVDSAVISVGKNADGTIEVPQPGPDLDKAAWYEQSPTPGRPGPSVIVGHVDTTAGRSVFFELGNLRPADTIHVTRDDGIAVTYTVDGVRAYPDKSDFPTELVYGGDLSSPTLRLVTCSNFDQETGHYLGNTVVFAHLTNVDKSHA